MHRVLRHPFTLGVAGALGGLVLGLTLIHLYYDHRVLHDLVNLVNANAAKATAP